VCRRRGAVGGELAGQARPLLKVGEQLGRHPDSGGEELPEQLGRGHALALVCRRLRGGDVILAGGGDLPGGGALACGPLVHAGPDPVELAGTA
jgi:hypothetical protein